MPRSDLPVLGSERSWTTFTQALCLLDSSEAPPIPEDTFAIQSINAARAVVLRRALMLAYANVPRVVAHGRGHHVGRLRNLPKHPRRLRNRETDYAGA